MTSLTWEPEQNAVDCLHAQLDNTGHASYMTEIITTTTTVKEMIAIIKAILKIKNNNTKKVLNIERSEKCMLCDALTTPSFEVTHQTFSNLSLSTIQKLHQQKQQQQQQCNNSTTTTK
ncbi:hypothetical protein HELRODRAFT_160504 [Helobdella robusta]|uniref:Uncharacterized protein n=1 Tax=Helobdella robusta TaxID=6412 RepID=T1EQC0_HELRO|nr:hypothetical protein HELRODRAFT_160504 [Helobdella robusta]ESO06339.1 hypothetical protein HELRODRAFT_160504 [Helobdella robusta]